MTDSELIDQVLLAIYNRKDRLHTGTKKLCEDEGIQFESDNQRIRIFHALRDSRYIVAFFREGEDGIITEITSAGIKYAENLIAEGLKETDRLAKTGQLELDIEEASKEDFHPGPETKSENIYVASENYEKHKDQSIEPCFGVETLADCFLKQLDTIIDTDSRNVCMVGIFAPWGRGKSYFFNTVKKKIKTRNKNAQDTYVNYDVVEFNAWKYQETPALWAYLFETLYRHKTWRFRVWHSIIRNWKPMFRDAIFFALPVIFTWLATRELENYCAWRWSAVIMGAIGWLANTISKHYDSAISFIKKYSKGISFANELGVQAEIEKEILSFLKVWVSNSNLSKNKIILYVEDIDRCSETKMVSIIDSLRTILENDEIRKRLIIICSIDADKIKKGIEYKFKELYEEKSRNKIAVEQLDKIFLTGISLPPLDKEQLEEYIVKLAQVQDTTNPSAYKQSSAPYSTRRTKHSFMVSTEASEELKINNKVIQEWMTEFLNSCEIKITPRKLRVIYYRILLANNILSSSNTDALFIKTIAEAIFNLSCGLICPMKSDEAQYDIVEMVVPYTEECNK